MASRELVNKCLQIIVFTVVILAGMALFAAFANFNALHEEFLGANFDSVHGARTLLKAQFFLRQAAERLEDSRIVGVDSQAFRQQAADALSLAVNYSAEGKAGTGSTRAELIGRILTLEAELGRLPAAGDAAGDAKLRALIADVASLADAFGVTELEDWGRLSSLNAELARRMGQLRLFIGAMSAIFLGIMAVLAHSLVRTRLAEAELKKAQAKAEAIQQTTLDASPMGIIYVDPRDLSNRRIIATNRQMTAIFGYPAEELLGLDVRCLYADTEDYRRSTDNFATLLAGGGIFRDEIPMRRKDGSHFWCAISGKAIESAGTAQGVVCMLEDISELKRTTEELKNARCQAESASRAKSEFLANMSHEIRTPFTGVLGMLELLLRTRLDSHQREHVQLAHNSTKQLLAIVDDILDLSKIEIGKLRIEASATHLRSLLEGIAQFHAMMAGNKKLGFSLDVDADAPDWILADPVRLRQVVDNLLGNAIKFTNEGKVELQIECLASDAGSSRVRCSVTDTGIGITPEMRERIFDKFTQADTSTARLYGGSGLGLAICRELVAAMGGVIGVDSIEGEGSCFWFEVDFPHADVPDITAAAGTAANDVTLPQHTCILLADDNDTSRKVIGEFLRLFAATVVEADNGEGAVALAREVNPDIILMDGQMPVCDGYEATRRIRAAEPAGTRVPIIALTAHAMEADREKCIAAGMDDYLTKPISSELLASRIAMHLQRSRPADGAAVDKEFDGEVLLAEDDLAIQTACRRLLQDLGCHVTVAGNGQEALELGERQDFDLLFLDCRMPILNGWETARRWRERERARNHPPTAIIAMTAGRYYGEHESCRAAGMNDVLLKPFNEDSLRLLLKEWLAPRHEEAKTSEQAT